LYTLRSDLSTFVGIYQRVAKFL